MTVFHKAWVFLKASRQTELGEFHPDFPSSYGPMTMISTQPTQANIDNRRMAWGNDFDERFSQPYEAFVHEGMKAKPVSDDSLDWEKRFRDTQTDIKPFNFEEGDTGNWFRPVMQLSASSMRNAPPPISYGWNNFNRTVGVRMPLDESMGMFRDSGYQDEDAEAFIYGDIPPERLVMVPGLGIPDLTWPGGLGRVDE